MKEANLFREYAREAMHLSFEAMAEYEKQTLTGLAWTWALAALTSERNLESIDYIAAHPSHYRFAA